MQHAVRVHRIVLSFMACMVQHILPCYKWYDFRGKKELLDMKVIFIFSANFPETYLAQRRIQRQITVNVHTSSCKVPIILVTFK